MAIIGNEVVRKIGCFCSCGCIRCYLLNYSTERPCGPSFEITEDDTYALFAHCRLELVFELLDGLIIINMAQELLYAIRRSLRSLYDVDVTYQSSQG
jgi:hypothetical protein